MHANCFDDKNCVLQVEDKRIEMEQKHNVLSEKYKSLSTTYQITKKQLIEMKV